MGYYIYTTESTAKIKLSNIDKAVETFKEWQRNNPRLGFTTIDDILSSKNIKELLNSLRYDCTIDFEYVYITDFIGEKYGEELTIHKVLAPFIEDNGYIEYRGEDGDIWRHIFKNGKASEIHPTMVWEEL